MWKAITAIFLFLLIVAGILVAKILQDKVHKSTETNTSFEQKGIIRVALDSYAGYYPLRSQETVSRLLKQGYRLELLQDDGDYEGRADKLVKGEVDMAVFTIDSYILNAARRDFPGTIIAVLSESRGSDAMIARTSVVGSLDDLKANENIRVSYTPKSPSHHLIKTIGAHFGVDHFLKRKTGWRVEVNGSEEALKALVNGRSDVAVLWEPQISRALENKEFSKILGTEATSGLIVDILVCHRGFLEKRQADAELLLATYFEVLKEFRGNPRLMVDGLAQLERVNKDLAEKMISAVQWKSLYDNALDWYGINLDGKVGRFGLYQNIERTVEVLIEAGDFARSPLPDGDPRRIFFDKLVGKLVMALGGVSDSSGSMANGFPALSESGWSGLASVGTLKVDPIPFNSGSGQIEESGMESIKALVEKLENYPRFRILVEGHSGTRGDRLANVELSLNRASAVKKSLVDQFQVDPNRIRAVGIGPDRPFTQLPDESSRAYQNRLSRVEVRFLKETY
jgi:ABC-type nitrate/sulfonate/bicarbonate transport system substrate-binding protein